MVSITACVGMYYFHMYYMYWYVLVCTQRSYVQVLIPLGKYWPGMYEKNGIHCMCWYVYVFMYFSVLTCIGFVVCIGIYGMY